MKNTLFRGLTALSLGTLLAAASTSCTKDLDQTPRFELSADKVYVDLAGYKQVLGKLYGGYALTSSQGPGGAGDIAGIDGGTSDYLRQLWSAQELTTDEAVVAWGDPGVQDWHRMNWDAGNVLIRGLYNRCYYEISICNEFIRQASDDNLNRRLPAGDVATAQQFRAEARFLRAVAYSHVIDLFGNGPFVTEAGDIGTTMPPYYTRKQLYDYVESELKDLTTQLAPARSNEYGRVDQAAAHGYLARLYLNAGVYTGTAQFDKAAAEAKQVIDAGYSLVTDASSASSAYGRLFLADNNLAPAKNEIVWPVVFDANSTQSYGGTTFLINGSTNSSNSSWQRYVGQTTGWNGLRTTSALFDKFFLAGGDTARDRRGRFWTGGQSLTIASLGQFSDGLGVIKYRNVPSDGSMLMNTQNFSSVDFPMLRLADMMLIYAEATARGAAGTNPATALSYVNQIRRRGFGLPIGTASTVADITQAQMTPDFILDERARELHWEGHRRSDLIRYDKFTTAAYLWPWKGNEPSGKAVDRERRLFPIPSSDLTANTNLKQNPGYN